MKIKTRDDLLSTLAEASELDHNLMCLYLYAVASLKQSTAEGITQAELEAIISFSPSGLTKCSWLSRGCVMMRNSHLTPVV